jgi:hypothetical protein
MSNRISPARVTEAATGPTDVARIRRAAWAFTTRRVPPGALSRIITPSEKPVPGDLVLARVDGLGQHRELQLASGRKKTLFEGDEIVVAYGNRYAPNQFEAVVPDTIGPCQLVAGGGVAAKALSWHSRIKGPTHITPIGLLADSTGARANLRDYAVHSVTRMTVPEATIVAVVGTSMDSGKTQTAAFVVRGLTRAGIRAGFAKVTGTGAGGDTWLLRDAGADPVLDFTDAGHVSTYLLPEAEVERTFVTLVAHLAASGVDAIVLEVADGVFQRETAALLRSPVFHELVGGVLFAAQDSMGAAAGASWLRGESVPVVGLSGVLTAAPLQREEAAGATGLPLYSREELSQPAIAMAILGAADGKRRASEELRTGYGPSVFTEPS